MGYLFCGQLPASDSKLYTNDFLDSFRTKGDPLADAVVEQLLSGPPVQADPLLLVEEKATAGETVFRNFLEHARSLPPWLDYDKMLPGGIKCLRNTLQCGVSLLAGSLVESYASARASKVLIRTGRLETDVRQRLYETAHFVFEISKSGGPRPGTECHNIIIRVRLMHAFVRRSMSLRADFEQASWGLPVNQEDYTSTLLMFSYVFVRGLQLLGVALSLEERESIQHLWRFVGYIMGVEEALLTNSLAQEEELYIAISNRQFVPDEDSKLLAHSLISGLSSAPPFYLPEQALFELSRRFVGENLADFYEFPRSFIWEQLLGSIPITTHFLNQIQDFLPFAGDFAVQSGKLMTKAIIESGLESAVSFRA